MNLREIFGSMLIIVLLLALTVPMVETLDDAKYGYGDTDANVVVVDTSNTTVLEFGNIRNETGYITMTLNQTESNGLTTLVFDTHYTVSYLGTYAVGANITFSTLNETKTYLATITYDYLLAAEQVGLLNLIPIIWIMALISALAITIVVLVREIS